MHAAHRQSNSLPSLKEIARLLGGEIAGSQVSAPGPGHSPHDRSLSVKLDPDAPDGLLVHSFAGDDPLRLKDYVRAKIGLEEWKPRKPNGLATERKIVATYDYVDEHGVLLFRVDRFDPKDFRQRRPDGNGGWIWSLGEARRVLYRLPELLEAIATEKTIFVAEGEKAVDALVELGIPATCSPHGAGKWRDEYSAYLKGAEVVILPDNDEPGELHCETVTKSLMGIAKRVRVLRLPELPPHGDAYDWIQVGGTAEQLWALVEADPTSSAREPQRGRSLISRCAADIKPEKVTWLWDQRLPLGKCVTVAGEGGLGKTMVLIWIAAAISRGGAWPCNEGRDFQGKPRFPASPAGP